MFLDINVDDLIRRFANTYSNRDYAKSQGKPLTHAYKNGLGMVVGFIGSRKLLKARPQQD